MPDEKREAAIIDFTQAISLLIRRARAATALSQFSLTESAVMARLAYEGPATIAILARAEGVKPQSMGATVTALEDAGLVRRKPHPTDGRQMSIELTAKGAAARKSALDAGQAWFVEALGRIDRGDQETLLAAGQIIKRMLK